MVYAGDYTTPQMWSRWVVLVVTIYMMIIGGTLYSYPAWSPSLKCTMNYSVAEMNFIGVCVNAGVWTSVVGGFILDKFGVRVCSIGAAALVVSGYGAVVYGIWTAHTWRMPAVLMGTMCLIANQGMGWVYLMALKLSVNNFPVEYRGKVVGSSVCFFGLSSGLFTQYYNAFSVSAAEYLIALTFGAVVMCTLSFCFCEMLPSSAFMIGEHRLANRISVMYIFAILLCVAVLISSFLQVFSPVFSLAHPHLFVYVHTGILLLFLTLLPGCPLKHPTFEAVNTEQVGLVPKVQEESLPPLQMMKRLDFWLMFFSFLLTIGPGVAFVNNLPSFVISREPELLPQQTYVLHQLPHYATIACLVSLFAVFNTFGRMASGYLSDATAGRVSRITWLSFACLLMAVVQFGIAHSPIDYLYFWVIPFGYAYGGLFSILPTLTSEVYGVNHFAANWGTMQMGPTIGAFIFSSGIASQLNDHFQGLGHLVKVTDDPKGSEVTEYCLGHDCYSYLMMIGCLSSLLAVVNTFVLAWYLKRQKVRAALLP